MNNYARPIDISARYFRHGLLPAVGESVRGSIVNVFTLSRLRAAEDDPGKDPVPEIIAALASPDEGIRGYAAELLRHYPSPRSVAPLILLLTDESEWVRSEAVETLGFLRDPAAVPALLRVADDPDELVRTNVAEALGILHAPTADVIAALLRLLGDNESVVRAFAAESLGDLGDISVIPSLKSHGSDVPVVRVWVFYALSRLAQPFDWENVLSVLRRGDTNARSQAISVLRLIATDQNSPRIAAAFRRALQREKTPALREQLLWNLRDLESVPPAGDV